MKLKRGIPHPTDPNLVLWSYQHKYYEQELTEPRLVWVTREKFAAWSAVTSAYWKKRRADRAAGLPRTPKPRLTPDERELRHRYCALRTAARERGINFSVSLAEFEALRTTHCPVFGTPFTVGAGADGCCSDESATIDRIDNRKGYEVGNLLMVSHKANRIKSTYTVEELMQVAEFYKSLANTPTA